MIPRELDDSSDSEPTFGRFRREGSYGRGAGVGRGLGLAIGLGIGLGLVWRWG
jgi:hypothetical protein